LCHILGGRLFLADLTNDELNRMVGMGQVSPHRNNVIGSPMPELIPNEVAMVGSACYRLGRAYRFG
jgi:hypothetical protein